LECINTGLNGGNYSLCRIDCDIGLGLAMPALGNAMGCGGNIE